ncbi:MAG: hypothetical protein LBT04_04100 [Prevotellaceae bacterium]|nr:hypothetical protein [Prevotellaceae bacterium]
MVIAPVPLIVNVPPVSASKVSVAVRLLPHDHDCDAAQGISLLPDMLVKPCQ